MVVDGTDALTECDARTLRTAALDVLRNNRRQAFSRLSRRPRRYTCPSPTLYPFQWFWDSCFHAVALAHLEPEVAREELELLFSAQRPSGFIPHVVFWDRRQLLRHQLYWCWLQSRDRGVPRRTALIQPPVIAAAVERYVEVTGDGALARWALPRLDAYFAWLARERDHDSDGLITIIAPWESGMDHCPAYDTALGLGYPAAPRDLILRPRLIDLANRARGYQRDKLFSSTRTGRGLRRRFLVDDVLVNATYADGMRALARLHARFDVPTSASPDGDGHSSDCTATTPHTRASGHEPTTSGHPTTGGSRPASHPASAPPDWDARAARTEAALLARLRGDDGFFHHRDRCSGRLVPVRTVAGLTPLLLPGLSDRDAAPLLHALADPTRFGAPFPVPSVAMDERAFCPTDQHYGAGPIIWRGPTWLNLNWLLARALRRRGESSLARRLTASSFSLTLRSGFREHYNPFTGAGYGPHSFGWSTLVVDMIR